MNFISNLFRRITLKEPNSEKEFTAQLSTVLTAKEKQALFVKYILKPLLKTEGYKTAGNKWWKVSEPFFNFIELQNFSWNSLNSVNFCFNFTTGLTSDIKSSNKPTIHDGIPYVRESYFKVEVNDYWTGANGYHIEDKTDMDKFTEQVLNDFNQLIIPKFSLLTNEDAIVGFYSDEFWGPRVKQSLSLGSKNLQINN